MKKKIYPAAGIFLLFISVFALLLLFLPKAKYSANEKRYLADPPAFQADHLLDGSYFTELENYISDHFPFRDAFVGINAYYELLLGRNGANGVYKGKDGYLIAAAAPLERELCEKNARLLRDFAESNGVTPTVLLVPTAGYTLDKMLPKNHGPYYDDEIFAIANKYFGENLMDLRPIFAQNNDKQLYYKTDHHLTAEGSYLMYQTFCLANGYDPIGVFSNKEILNGFYGTNYSKSGLWFQKPDTLEIWHRPSEDKFEVTIDDITASNTYQTLYFREHEQNADKYPIYLNGNHALVKIRNMQNQNGKKLLIIRDSYAHCFATFLCENYEEIYLVDPRYYRLPVSELMQTQEIHELLYVFGAENFSSLPDFGWLR